LFSGKDCVLSEPRLGGEFNKFEGVVIKFVCEVKILRGIRPAAQEFRVVGGNPVFANSGYKFMYDITLRKPILAFLFVTTYTFYKSCKIYVLN